MAASTPSSIHQAEFIEHGVATDTANHRGTVATVDGDGKNVVLVWLFDHRGGYAMLVIDAATGESQQVPVPFDPGGNTPFASILSSQNRYYSHFNGWFSEFDPATRSFTFHGQTGPGMAMGMTEDDAGRIWMVSYPDSDAAWFDPETRELRDLGTLHDENWPQYQRHVAADDAGWVYFAVGNTKSQIVAIDPDKGTGTPLLDDAERVQGTATLYRDQDGRVYGSAKGGKGATWLGLHQGRRETLPGSPPNQPKPIITGTQGLFHQDFPDGSKLVTCDLIERQLIVADPSGKEHEHRFDYESEGAHLMGLAVAPDGSICGGTSFPMRFFRYDPGTDSWINRAAMCQCNCVATQGDRFFIGEYVAGFLLEWDPSQPWVNTKEGKEGCNPAIRAKCSPDIYRPHCLLPHPDGRTIIMGGTPDYGYTGGGLLFYDRQTEESTLLTHHELILNHSVMSLTALADGTVLCGSTIAAGTGGEVLADHAEMFIIDPATKQITWKGRCFDDRKVSEYTQLAPGPRGLVYGLIDNHLFFVFDPASKTMLHHEETGERFGGAGYQQGPRRIITTPGGETYLLLRRAIVRVDPETFELTTAFEPPIQVGPGGDVLDGRIYFASGPRVYSWRTPEAG